MSPKARFTVFLVQIGIWCVVLAATEIHRRFFRGWGVWCERSEQIRSSGWLEENYFSTKPARLSREEAEDQTKSLNDSLNDTLRQAGWRYTARKLPREK